MLGSVRFDTTPRFTQSAYDTAPLRWQCQPRARETKRDRTTQSSRLLGGSIRRLLSPTLSDQSKLITGFCGGSPPRTRTTSWAAPHSPRLDASLVAAPRWGVKRTLLRRNRG